MDWIIIASIGITVASAIGGVLNNNADGGKDKIPKWVLIGLAIAGGVATFFLAKGDAADTKGLKIHIANSDSSLRVANERLQVVQQESKEGIGEILTNLAALQKSAEQEGLANTTIINGIGNIKTQLTGLGEKIDEVPLPPTLYVHIPVGDRNPGRIDSKSHVSVISDSLDRYKKLRINLNTYRDLGIPIGGTLSFKDAQGKDRVIVYEGIKNGLHTFYIYYK